MKDMKAFGQFVANLDGEFLDIRVGHKHGCWIEARPSEFDGDVELYVRHLASKFSWSMRHEADKPLDEVFAKLFAAVEQMKGQP